PVSTPSPIPAPPHDSVPAALAPNAASPPGGSQPGRRSSTRRRGSIRYLWVAAGTLAVLAGLAWLARPSLQQWLPGREHVASIVVLPFIDMSSEHADQPFCDGLTEELSNWLAQLPALRVVARTSAFKFRGLNEDVRDIGKALDATHVLEGSMRR